MRRLATTVLLLTLTGCGGKAPWEMGPFRKFATLVAKPTPTPPPAPTPAPAAISAETLGAVLTKLGLAHRVEADSEGAPAFYLELDGAKVGMFTYLDAGKVPVSVEFSAGFSMQTTGLEARVAEWNQKKRYCRAAIRANGDPELRYDVDLVACGFEGQLEEAVNTYRSMLREYRTHIGFD